MSGTMPETYDGASEPIMRERPPEPDLQTTGGLGEPFGESEIITLPGFASNDSLHHSGAGFNKVKLFIAKG
jgi:hypothetical protein